MPIFAEVALPVPRLEPLTYAVPEDCRVEPGFRVAAPLGRRVVAGVVTAVRQSETAPALRGKIKPLIQILDESAALPAELLELGQWMASYYRCSWGEALAAMLPAVMKPARPRKTQAPPPPAEPAPEATLGLTADQARAMAAIRKALDGQTVRTMLLHGVTGSGKTEIYLQAIAHVLEQGRSAIFLVPEISLTPQTCRRVTARFGGRVSLLHSGLSPRERADSWARLRRGESRVALGARSAVFAPLPDLGLIVVDEEPEGSYKQEDAPRYHARDVAAVRAKASRALLLLGSATPSVETFSKAEAGRFELLSLPERVDGKLLPEIRMVDLGQAWLKTGNYNLISDELLTGLEKNLASGGQSILFLNRRGYAPVVMCPECRHVIACPDCSVAMVYHQAGDCLRCHSCGRRSPARPACPKCGTACVRLRGAGTQRVEDEIRNLLPQARVIRVDLDATRKRGYLEEAFGRFGRREADILIGTQMVAKGIDFPGVTLVGIISADTGLHLPDFRAEERAFQLIVQVAGRAGRGERPGLVLVQTLNAGHPVLALAQSQDYVAFYRREIAQRQALRYPPFARLANVVCRSQNAEAARECAAKIARRLSAAAGPGDAVLGPAPSPREKVAGQARYQVLVKSQSPGSRARLLASLDKVTAASGVFISVDVDPLNLL